MINNLVAAEEAKRNRHLDPAERWRLIQAAIDWADSQQTVRRSTKEACLANQARLLAGMKGVNQCK
ncbi:MAG TPA: hypothetical protein VMP01_06745 [Pirellulaceae bacterium]|nr:hypothetical protein [Pirellulaceae bacterium]